MLVYIVAIAEAMVYIGAVPLCAAFCLSVRDGVRLGVGLSAFVRRAALRRARRYGVRLKVPMRPGSSGLRRARFGVRLLRGAGVSVRGRVNLGDAAATALACGTLGAVVSALGIHAGRLVVEVAPDFTADAPHVELQGMIRLRTGQIMIAAAQGGIDDISRRIAKWTGIPSKAS